MIPVSINRLTTILVRATITGSLDPPSAGSHSDAALCADLAYALWLASLAPDQGITRNPQPIPTESDAPGRAPDGALSGRD